MVFTPYVPWIVDLALAPPDERRNAVEWRIALRKILGLLSQVSWLWRVFVVAHLWTLVCPFADRSSRLTLPCGLWFCDPRSDSSGSFCHCPIDQRIKQILVSVRVSGDSWLPSVAWTLRSSHSAADAQGCALLLSHRSDSRS